MRDFPVLKNEPVTEAHSRFHRQMMTGTLAGNTSCFLNGQYVSQEVGNSYARETAVKLALIAEYGPVRLIERLVGGNGRVALSYRTIG